ncbi:MAG: 5-formyltetrahydrofolate cyclo-ligase [Opitutia bacterium]|nr:5-formyltetrahydrofolate cyclo-ligase [Opitutales bacterium]PHX69341.1 MAG: 5-formyltetrahydrofolate cyclo-ligase [Opitutae bacterium]
MDPQEVKVRLRQELKSSRESVGAPQREAAAIAAEAKIVHLPEWQNAKVVCLYASFQGELPTTQLLQNLLNSEKRCVLPKVNSEGQPELYEIKSFQDLELSSLEILEPKINCPRINPTQIDFFLVPGIGFDRRGNRLGHGAGFYDRLLAQASPTAYFLGYGYDFQVVDAIPHEAHDIVMHAMATPSQIIYIKPA